ncbi:uncharacterized protein [Acropora muricata]|uniref:uncharacterized protein isoform X2 n=1 Tax=Acropora muricata TaxID=159855 RepID=UPI0034E6042B
MTISKFKLLLPLVILFVGIVVSASASINDTRSSKSDAFTNPNHTAIDKCESVGRKHCRCLSGYPTYLAHLRKCLSLPQLRADVFGQGSEGCSQWLELKGGGDSDDDNDKRRRRDGDEDDKRKDVCEMMPWNLPVINFNSSCKAKIKFCGQKKIDSCDLVAVRYSGVGDWQNISDFMQTFWALKRGKDIFFQWNKTRVSPFSGVLIVVNLRWKQNEVSFSSCFMFKTGGTQTVSGINQPTTTETKTKSVTTSIVATTKETTTSTTTTSKAHNAATLPRSDSSGDVSTSESVEPTKPTEHAELTEPTNGGKFLNNSNEGNKKRLTLAVVPVICAVLVFFALSITAVCFVKKRKQRRQIPENTRPKSPFDDQSMQPYDDVYENQNNAYQLLQRDGKSGHWEEAAAYQDLAKGTSAGNRSQVEVYSNPSTYQDLQRSGTVSNGDSPVYQSLVKQQENSTENAQVDDCGYLLLLGEHDKKEGTADSRSEDNPYYHKLEENDKVETATDSGEATPYYYTLEQVHE